MALGSFQVFLLGSAVLPAALFCRIVLGVDLTGRIPEPASVRFLVGTGLPAIAGGILGRYLWLAAMARVLRRAHVTPLLASGYPRRIGRLDARLIRRLYPEEPKGGAPRKESPELTRREIWLLRLVLLLIAVLVTAMIPSAYRYPKHDGGDWLVFAILVFTVAGLWAGTVWFWRFRQGGEG